jgi:PAS domain S-box-containing protein/putative nucleotidyltransferase with HDIG domain
MVKEEKLNQVSQTPEKTNRKNAEAPRPGREGIRKMLNELQTRQVELEMQKVELTHIQDELQTARNRFDEINHSQFDVDNLSPEAILSVDKNLNFVSWNKASEAMFGWKAEEIIGSLITPQLHSKILRALSREEVLTSLATNGSWTGKETSYRKDNSPIDTLLSLCVIWNTVGGFNGIVAIHHTIKKSFVKSTIQSDDEINRKGPNKTEDLLKTNRMLQQELEIHKQSAILAKESEGKNRDLVDNIKLGIFRCTPGTSGKFLEINKAMEEITGYSREELLQMEVCNLFNDEQGSEQFNNEVNITDWKVTRELGLKRNDGQARTVAETVVAIRFDSGAIQYFDGILEDITERKQAQVQLQQSLQRLQKTIKEIIQAMAYIGEVRDPYTAGHQRRVAQLSFEIAKMMGLQDQEYEGLTMAAFVHDIGKILVPADILSKPGKLTKPEFDMLKDHTRIGYEILKTIEFPWPIAKIVLQHHERMDGSGYPAGLMGNQIIIEAKILAVADVVEAMSSHRPYRPALGVDKALEEINQHRGTLYDTQVVDACVKLFTDKGFNLN